MTKGNLQSGHAWCQVCGISANLYRYSIRLHNNLLLLHKGPLSLENMSISEVFYVLCEVSMEIKPFCLLTEVFFYRILYTYTV